MSRVFYGTVLKTALYNTNTAIPNQTVDDDYITAFKLDQVTYRYYRLEFAKYKRNQNRRF